MSILQVPTLQPGAPEPASGIASLTRYSVLWWLFVLGYAIHIVLWFVPVVSMKVGGGFFSAPKEEAFSAFSYVRATSHISPGWTLFMVFLFALNIVFIVLAIAYPRRWIFITASSVAVFLLLWGLFRGENPNLHYFLLPRLLDYVAYALTLTGFLINPARWSGGGSSGIGWLKLFKSAEMRP